jgi:hypothetical protein
MAVTAKSRILFFKVLINKLASLETDCLVEHIPPSGLKSKLAKKKSLSRQQVDVVYAGFLNSLEHNQLTYCFNSEHLRFNIRSK